MKKLLFAFLALFCASGTMAQVSSEPKDETPVIAYADKETGVIIITVPQTLRIRDKVFVENNSAMDIVQMAVMADYNRDDKYVSVLNVLSIPMGATKLVAESDTKAYISLRGKTLKMKIKGCKPKTEKISYDFNVSLYESKHDLYIKVGSNDDALDF